jgi:hypothetical protein
MSGEQGYLVQHVIGRGVMGEVGLQEAGAVGNGLWRVWLCVATLQDFVIHCVYGGGVSEVLLQAHRPKRSQNQGGDSVHNTVTTPPFHKTTHPNGTIKLNPALHYTAMYSTAQFVFQHSTT